LDRLRLGELLFADLLAFKQELFDGLAASPLRRGRPERLGFGRFVENDRAGRQTIRGWIAFSENRKAPYLSIRSWNRYGPLCTSTVAGLILSTVKSPAF
jgi:hypothetical protein